MAIRNMRKDGDDILRKKSRPVEVFDKKLHQLLDDMGDTLDEYCGVGLAGVQVGMLKRLFILDMGEKVTEFINPVILETSGEQTGAEGCLSYPGEWGLVTRPNYAKVKAQDRFGRWFEAEGEALFARAVCHEYDHLEGIIYKDHAIRMLSPEELEDMGEEDDEE